MRTSRLLLLALSVLAVSLALPALQADSDAYGEREDAGPWDDYPDADFIITENDRHQVRVSQKVFGEPAGSDPESFVWKDRYVSQDSDLSLIRWTDVNRDLRVVLDGARLGDLSVITVDDVSDSHKFANLEFLMYSGSLESLKLVDVSPGQVGNLGDDYSDMFDPIFTAQVKLYAGHMGCFNPTSEMIRIDCMEVIIGQRMSVDRFYTSGENGSYGDLFVGLRGGSVGYMTNVQARIGTLTYELDYGSVDYFAIGADTEHSSTRSLSDASTSFVTGDVDVYINPETVIRHAITGGGVMEIPNVLWNGDRLQDAVVRNIVIEAEDHTVRGDTCFLNEKRDRCLRLAGYEIGDNPRTYRVSQYLSDIFGRTVDTYGPEGVWNGIGDIDINSGTSLFLNTTLLVASDGSVDIAMGGKMVSTDWITVYGQISVTGEAVNNSIIELCGEGTVNGRVTGSGMIADQIVSQSHDSVISVMSDYDTVIITQADSLSLGEITAKLLAGAHRVTIKAQYEGMGFVSDSFLICLREISVSDTYVSGFELAVGGIDPNTLTACNVDITVPLTIPYGQTAKVYHYEPDGDGYREVEVIGSEYGNITFRTDAAGEYSIMLVDADTPAVPHVHEDETAEILLLVIGIAAVSSAMVYTFFKFRK